MLTLLKERPSLFAGSAIAFALFAFLAGMGGYDSIPLWTALLIAFGGSGFFLKYRLQFDSSPSSRIIPLIVAVVGIVVASQLRDFNESVRFLAAATAQFASFVFVSRLRQRGSFFWHAVASLASNATWYVTMHALDAARDYWWLYLIYVFGIVIGRTAGANWSQYIEQRYKLSSDATRDPHLAPGQRLRFIAKEPTFWMLGLSLVGYIAFGMFAFEHDLAMSLLIVISLSILQNFAYALYARFQQRGNNWLIAASSILASITFYLSAGYLFSKSVPFLLLVPYMLATTMGSVSGTFFSMIIERFLKVAPDAHLGNKEKEKNPWKDRLPYAVIMGFAAVWILFQKQILSVFGYETQPVLFPLPMFDASSIPYPLILLSATLLFFLDEAFHTLMSRAGNRNHTGYHVATCIPKGLVNFAKVSYISLNPRVPDLIPAAILAGCLGSLFGKDISERIERWLQARMDVETK
jgi:hypothetical protein